MQTLITKINALIDEEYKSLKSESVDYRELKRNMEKMERDIAWENPKIAEYIKKRFREMLYKEVQNMASEQKVIRTEKRTKLILEGAEEYKAEIKKMRKEVLELKEAAEETMQMLKRLTEFKEISASHTAKQIPV